VVVALVVGAAVAVAAFEPWRQQPVAGQPLESPTAAASHSATVRPSATPTSPANRTLSEEDFDSLTMGSGPGDGWWVQGPAGSVAVAALPTAVDRSMRLLAGSEYVQACRAVAGPGTAMAIDVDLMFDAVPSTGTSALMLRLASRGLLEARLGSGARMQIFARGAPVTALAVTPHIWYRLSVRIVAGAAIVHLGPREELATALSVNLPAQGSGGFDAACFRVPAGAAASLYLDNVALAR
jgi:hypothetical protein